MLSRKQLLNKLSMMNLDVYETVSDIFEENAIQLLNFEEFGRFIKSHAIETVFYHYTYIKAEVLKIDDELLEETNPSETMMELIADEIEVYNATIDKVDFSRPCWVNLYFTYQGFMYYIEEADPWYEEEFDPPRFVLKSIIDKHVDEEADIQDEAKLKREKERENLRKQIMDDPEFHKCTNKQLRRNYGNNLFSGNEELQALFFKPKGGLYDMMILDYIEQIWRDSKQMK